MSGSAITFITGEILEDTKIGVAQATGKQYAMFKVNVTKDIVKRDGTPMTISKIYTGFVNEVAKSTWDKVIYLKGGDYVSFTCELKADAYMSKKTNEVAATLKVEAIGNLVKLNSSPTTSRVRVDNNSPARAIKEAIPNAQFKQNNNIVDDQIPF